MFCKPLNQVEPLDQEFLDFKSPFCQQCNKDEIDYVKLGKLWTPGSQCRNPECLNQTPMFLYSEPVLVPGGLNLQYVPNKKIPIQDFPPIQATKTKNNIRETIETRFGEGSYSTEYYVSNRLPQNMKTNIPPFSAKTQQAVKYVMENEQFLPIELKQSSIPGAGTGTFVTENIRKNNTLIGYIGQIVRSGQFVPASDSLYGIGWVSDGKVPEMVVIEPNKKLNVGRFVNSKQRKKCNCRIQFGLVDGKLCLVLFTTRDIKKGQQLFYFYGKDYTDGRIFDPTSKNLCQNMVPGQMNRILSQMGTDRLLQYGDIRKEIQCWVKQSNRLDFLPAEEGYNEVMQPQNNMKMVDQLNQSQQTTSLTKKKASKLYRQFSRQKYNKFRHQFPRMRESQVVQKVIKQYLILSNQEKINLYRHYSAERYFQRGLASDDSPQEQPVSDNQQKVKPIQNHQGKVRVFYRMQIKQLKIIYKELKQKLKILLKHKKQDISAEKMTSLVQSTMNIVFRKHEVYPNCFDNQTRILHQNGKQSILDWIFMRRKNQQTAIQTFFLSDPQIKAQYLIDLSRYHPPFMKSIQESQQQSDHPREEIKQMEVSDSQSQGGEDSDPKAKGYYIQNTEQKKRRLKREAAETEKKNKHENQKRRYERFRFCYSKTFLIDEQQVIKDKYSQFNQGGLKFSTKDLFSQQDFSFKSRNSKGDTMKKMCKLCNDPVKQDGLSTHLKQKHTQVFWYLTLLSRFNQPCFVFTSNAENALGNSFLNFRIEEVTVDHQTKGKYQAFLESQQLTNQHKLWRICPDGEQTVKRQFDYIRRIVDKEQKTQMVDVCDHQQFETINDAIVYTRAFSKRKGLQLIQHFFTPTKSKPNDRWCFMPYYEFYKAIQAQQSFVRHLRRKWIQRFNTNCVLQIQSEVFAFIGWYLYGEGSYKIGQNLIQIRRPNPHRIWRKMYSYQISNLEVDIIGDRLVPSVFVNEENHKQYDLSNIVSVMDQLVKLANVNLAFIQGKLLEYYTKEISKHENAKSSQVYKIEQFGKKKKATMIDAKVIVS